ncbi:MAG: CRTAC1 family protein [Planctomycetes bacterium]|nr:CRTAC1 family protein [Planctomycetota bacterium]
MSEVEAMRRRVADDSFLAKINAEETHLDNIERALISPWQEAWRERDAAAYGRLLSAEFTSISFANSERELRTERDGLCEYDWKPSAADTSDAEAYLAQFSEIVDFTVKVASMQIEESATTLVLKYDLRGVLADERLRTDRGTLVLVASEIEGSWKMTSLGLQEFETLETVSGREPAFTDQTSEMGLGDCPVVSRSEAIRRGGYALAVADFDDDNRPDILVGHYGNAQLLRNTKAGFEDVTSAAGIREETLVKSAVIADFDNDGMKDIVMLRFVDVDPSRHDWTNLRAEHKAGDVVAYRNVGNGKFEYQGNILPRKRFYERAMPMAAGDFDGNGTLDLYIGFPGARDFTTRLKPEGIHADVYFQGIWLNDGKWGFSETEQDTFVSESVVPHAALVTDMNSDSKPDLIVVDDALQENSVYVNDGEAHFTRIEGESGPDIPGIGMSAAAGDFDGDGRIDLLMTKIDITDSIRLVESWKDREADEAQAEVIAGLSDAFAPKYLFRNLGNGKYEEVSKEAGVEWLGDAPGIGDFLDYNNDGHLDIYVTNGLWSGGDEDITSLFTRLIIQRGARFDENDRDEADSLELGRNPAENPNPLLAMLRDFREEGDALPSLGFAGNERNRLFRNNGDGTFTEVGFLEGADRIEDGYVFAKADFDGDGRQDMVLRNCDPAPGRPFPGVVMLRNNCEGGNSLTVYLEGIESNRDGIGSTVTARVGDRLLVRELRSVSGATQSNPAAFFGLGDATAVDRLEVRWPSGTVEVFENVSAGKRSLREGSATLDAVSMLSDN